MIAYIAAVYHRERENDSYFYILTALEKQQQQKSKNINGMATKVAKPLFLFWHWMRKFPFRLFCKLEMEHQDFRSNDKTLVEFYLALVKKPVLIHCSFRFTSNRKHSSKFNGKKLPLRVVVVAQLVERSLPTPEIRSLNPNIGKILSTNCLLK